MIENFLSKTESSTLAKLGAKYDRYSNQPSAFREDPTLQLSNLCVAVESMWTLSVMMEPLTTRIRGKLRNGEARAPPPCLSSCPSLHITLPGASFCAEAVRGSPVAGSVHLRLFAEPLSPCSRCLVVPRTCFDATLIPEPNNRQSVTLAGAWLLPKPIRKAAYALFSADVSAGLVRAVSSCEYDLPDKQQESLKASKFVDYVNKRVAQTFAQ